jgi:hypothetical protein
MAFMRPFERLRHADLRTTSEYYGDSVTPVTPDLAIGSAPFGPLS